MNCVPPLAYVSPCKFTSLQSFSKLHKIIISVQTKKRNSKIRSLGRTRIMIFLIGVRKSNPNRTCIEL